MGEPAGIGPDITLRAWLHGRGGELPPFVYIGCPRVLADRAAVLNLDIAIAEVTAPAEAVSVFAHALPVLPQPCLPAHAGKASAKTANAVIKSIQTTVHLALAGEVAAVVTNPIAKSILTQAGFPFPGHTEFLAHLAQEAMGQTARPHPVMMLVSDDLKVVPVTIHIPLAKIPDLLTTDLIFETGIIVANDLASRFNLNRPRIALSGLNPHAGEDGTMGLEESQTIAPAMKRLRDAGIDVSGPWPADSMFHAGARNTYDVALCMYHDQALIPIKTLAFDLAVNTTLGLNFVRTSPDHGTAFDLAGKGTARPFSLIQALKLGASMAGNDPVPGAANPVLDETPHGQ